MKHVVYEKKIENKALLNKFALIFTNVIGLGLLIGGICLSSHVSDMEKEYKSVVAKIINIEKHTERRNGETRTDYDVTVSYQVNDSIYTRELSEYSSSMEIGGNVTLMYNPADPSKVHSTDILKVFSIGLMVAGALVILLYWLVMRRLIKKVLLREKQEGQK